MRISDWSSDVCSSDLRLHRDLPEIDSSTPTLERGAYEVVIAHRCAAAGDEDVRAFCRCERAGKRSRVIRNRADAGDMAAKAADHRRQHCAVAGRNLVAAKIGRAHV